jgi:serine/threonine-protein kinase
MADVYRAYHSGLDRYVAIKVMHSHLSEDTDFVSRFQREAKSVAALKHPNICGSSILTRRTTPTLW